MLNLYFTLRSNCRLFGWFCYPGIWGWQRYFLCIFIIFTCCLNFVILLIKVRFFLFTILSTLMCNSYFIVHTYTKCFNLLLSTGFRENQRCYHSYGSAWIFQESECIRSNCWKWNIQLEERWTQVYFFIPFFSINFFTIS